MSNQYNRPMRPGTEAPDSGVLAWMATGLVWILATFVIIVVMIVAGRYAFAMLAPDDLPRAELLQTLGGDPLGSKESGHVQVLPWLEVRVLGFTGVVGDWNPVEAVAFREDNRRLVSLALSEIILWDLEKGSVAARVRTSDYNLDVRELAFFAGGSRIALFSDFDPIQIFDGQSLAPVGTLPRSDGDLMAVKPDAAGDLWYAVGEDEELVIRRISALKDLALFRQPIPPYDFDGALNAPPRPVAVRLDPDQRRLVLLYAGGEQEVLGWDEGFALSEMESPETIDSFAGLVVEEEEFESTTAIVRSRSIAPRLDLARLEHIGPFTSSAVSRDGRLIATGSEDMLVRIWKAPARQP